MNRAADVGPLLAPGPIGLAERLLPPVPRSYGVTIVTNDPLARYREVALTTPPGASLPESVPLTQTCPHDVYSLSHVALPFPLQDGVYGMTPDPADDHGIALDPLAPKSEFGVLVLGLEQFARMTSNPFFDYLRDRMLGGVPG